MIELMKDWKRTNSCGELSEKDIGRDVILMGWVHSRRDLGNLIFVDLRDREGITQIVFDPAISRSAYKKAENVRPEWVIAVKGKVFRRVQENPKLKTGKIEVRAEDIKILNVAETTPFQISGKVDGSEILRLRYRYLELRRKEVIETFRLRNRISSFIRSFLEKRGFIEIETPYLTKSTPEGARDYLVPSRIHKGKFYALPQSPQLFKQILMIGGVDRYYQIARCFRDEDLRADRQPEFTQVDVEMSFADEEDVMSLFEDMMRELFEEILGYSIEYPIKRLTYDEAIERYGTDKPDTRFDMEIKDITDIAKRSSFKIFLDTVEKEGAIKGIVVERDLSRKELDELSEKAKQFGAKGIFWIKIKEDGWQSPLKKYFGEKEKELINKRLSAKKGDTVIIVSDKRDVVNSALGMIRKVVSEKIEPKKRFSFVWIKEFPLFKYDEQGRLTSVHHPFTMPKDIDLLEKDPMKVKARSYDLVLNGEEIGGGSVRIHLYDLQKKIFRILGISDQEAEKRFGFFLEALRYGAPPHAGMAIGFDRLVAIMAGKSSIREVIAFPKTTSAVCPLTGAPEDVDRSQLDELGIDIKEKKDEG